MMVYQWKPRVLINIDAQTAGEHIEKLKEKTSGKITADDVVTDARKISSPIHSAFEWDDSEAAEKYRLDQARYLLRSLILVEYKKEEKEPIKVRAFVNIRETKADDEVQSFYVSTYDAMRDPPSKAQVLSRALKELKEWRDRYNRFTEFALLIEQIDSIIEKKKR